MSLLHCVCLPVACDADYTTSEIVKSLDPYGPNRRCVYTVTNPDVNMCINLFAVSWDLDEPNVNGTCDVTSVTVSHLNLCVSLLFSKPLGIA